MPTVGFFEGKFLPLHIAHINMAIRASFLVDKLYVILGYNKKRDAELCKKDNCKEIPPEIRLSWLGNSLRYFKNIEIHSIEDTDDEYNWEKMIPAHRAIFGNKLDYVFSSELSYSPIFKKIYSEAEHIILDINRKSYNMSGTEIRKDIFSNWLNMSPITRAFFVKKVLIAGVESTGKSTMVRILSGRFNTEQVQEIGRDYCEKYNNQITVSHFNEIAMKHYTSQIDALEKCNKYLFVDSDAIITKYYLQKYQNIKTTPLLEEIIKLQEYDYIFYLHPDVPWIDDGYRFLEDSRPEDNKTLRQMYVDYGYNLIDIHGSNYENRVNEVINRLNNDGQISTRNGSNN